MRTLASLMLVVALDQSRPVSDPVSSWPPAGVQAITDGVTRPEVLTRVEPTYTREAMRARLQGFVTLQFVVETDGSVGPVRVVTSLDPVNGLDAAAVAALKQWRFKPARKDGMPVRVALTLLLTFNLRDVPPPMTLPAGFDTASASSGTTWVQATVPMDGVLMHFSYPDGWDRRESARVAIIAIDPRSLRSVGVHRSAVLPGPIPFPMPIPQLARFAETIRIQQNRSGQAVETVAVGQSALGNVNWLWIEMEASPVGLQGPSSEIGAAIQDMIEGVHLWAFSTTVGSQLIQVLCAAPNPKGTPPADREANLESARADCSAVLKRISIAAR